jgi:hypothetical protein
MWLSVFTIDLPVLLYGETIVRKETNKLRQTSRIVFDVNTTTNSLNSHQHSQSLLACRLPYIGPHILAFEPSRPLAH